MKCREGGERGRGGGFLICMIEPGPLDAKKGTVREEEDSQRQLHLCLGVTGKGMTC